MEDSTKAEIIKGTTEIVKTAYEDAFQPVAKETGKALGTLGKTVNVALAPLRGIVWGYEQIEVFIHEKVSEKLEKKGVKKEDIVTPDPDIAVPTVEALRYSKLKDEFATLLASAMNAQTADQAHPAFVDILKQMSPLDAEIIRSLDHIAIPTLTLFLKIEPKGETEVMRAFGGKLAALSQTNSSKFLVAMDNLERLKIINVEKTRHLVDDKHYISIREQPSFKIISASLKEKNKERKGMLSLTNFGRMFKNSCI